MPAFSGITCSLIAAILLLMSGCGSPDQQQASAPTTALEQAADQSKPRMLNAAHILVMHKDSERAPSDIRRTKEEALERAKNVVEKAKADGADFAELAAKYSDGPTSKQGGNLGMFRPSMMVKEFSDATMDLAVGEVSDPVETQFGYHIILRKDARMISARHILVMHKDSERVPESITRTKEEARERIEECLQKVRDGGDFEALAREYSDGPSGPRGGDLGQFGAGQMVPAFDKAAFGAEVGEVTDVVETSFGFHIIQRY